MPGKSWSEMNLREKADYNSVYLNNLDTVNDAIVLQKMRQKADDITPAEEAEIDSKLLDLHYELGKLNAKYQARTSASTTISPPTEVQVAAAQKMAHDSDQLLADQAGVQAGFAMAKSAGDLMAQIQA